MKNKNILKTNKKWSIRRLTVGVASVAVASGVFILVSPTESAHAAEVANNNNTVAAMVQNEKDNMETSKEAVSSNMNKKDSTVEATTEVPSQPEKMDKAAEPVASSTEKEETTSANEQNVSQKTTPEQVTTAVAENVKATTEVPASYLANAKVPGPFLAGVNGVIPYEFFGGDGMLTRLLLKSSEMAPWSDNGEAKNAALLPLENLAKGQYFYKVQLDGNVMNLEGQELLNKLKENGTHTYKANVLVYAAKDGKADTSKAVAMREVMVTINVDNMMDNMNNNMMDNQNNMMDNMNNDMMNNQNNMMDNMNNDMMNDMNKNMTKKSLSQTGQESTILNSILGLLTLMAAAILGFFGIKRREN